MLHNICGRAKCGKTEYLLNVCKRLMDEKKHTFLIVPEQGAVITERQVIERLGNRSNEYIEVINFKRLCNRVFRETGGLTQSYVDSAHKLLVMHKALGEAHDYLTEYKGASEVSDFVKKAVDTVSEFRMYGITPKLLEDSAKQLSENGNKRLSAKLLDFSLIYAQYASLLTETFGYHDSSDDLDRLCSVLDSSGFFKGKTVIIDSFYGFTVPELHVIESMLRCADDVYISYLTDKDNEILFRRGIKAYKRICDLCEKLSVKQETVYPSFDGAYCGSSLKALERRFALELCPVAEKDETPVVLDGSVRLIACEDPYEEAKMASATVNYLTSKCGAKYSDIAICARSLESYKGILDTELGRNGIPFGFSQRYDLLTRPVSAYILAAFEFSKHRSKQSVLRMIKTGLTNLSSREADLTECYIRTWNIQGRMFFEEWLMNPDGYSSVSDMSEHTKRKLSKVEEARVKLITPLTVFDEEIRSAECANEISLAVMKLLEGSRYNVKYLSEDEKVYHNMVMYALDCIADVIGNEKISPKLYAALFEMILSEYDTGRIPVLIDEVNVADASLIRTTGNRYMIVLGLCDGVFPRIPASNGVFSDKEKGILADMGIELSENDIEKVYDELFLAYKVLSSPSDGLYLTYSERSAVGDKTSASEIVTMCVNALTGLKAESAINATDLRFCLCDDALVADALDESRPELSRAVSDYLISKGYDLSRITSIHKDYLSKETSAALFGETMSISPTRLDTFNNCACSYFARYILGLKPEAQANLGPTESGTIIHRILELLISEFSEMKARGKDITEEYALKRQGELLLEHINELLGSDKVKSKMTGRFKYLYGRLSGALEACVTALANEFTDSEFIPSDLEMSVGGKDADVPFASIPIKDEDGNTAGNLVINGKIDRTDIYRKDGKVYVKIVDYKTGDKVFRLRDVANGINLQMLLYLYSITENAKERYNASELVPSGVVYAPIIRPSLSVNLGKDISEESKSSFKPNGIVIDDMEILYAMDKTFSGKHVPVKLTKDGAFTQHSSVTSLETMGRLISAASDVAAKLCAEIRKGKIAKNPYRCKAKNSCSICDYAAFCRYKTGDEGTRYALTSYTDEVFELSVKKKED